MGGRSKSKRKIIAPKNKNSSLKWAILALVLVFSLIILSKAFSFVFSLGKPLNNPSFKKSYSWDGKSAITLAVKSDEISILNYDPFEKKVTILNIPNDTYLELPKGFGPWPIGSVYGLGQMENPPVGDSLLKLSISKLVGLPIDGFIHLKEGEKLDQKLAKYKDSFFISLLGLRNTNTDLSLIEMYKLASAITSVRSDKIISLDLSQTDITKSKLLGDSSRVLGVDAIKLDLYIRENMADSQFLQEDATISIYNATSQPGLAGEASRFITNLGGTVIFAANTQKEQTKTQVIFSNPQSYTAQKVARIFAPHCLIKPCVSDEPKVLSSRAAINIILGEDYYQLFHQR